MNRRVFLALCASAASSRDMLSASSGLGLRRNGLIDQTLRAGIARRQIPCVVAMVASNSKTLYSGAFGKRDSSGVPIKFDSIFRIASMTKAITTTAALQLVEQGKVNLEEPVAKYLPQFQDIQVLDGFDAEGKAILHPALTQPTLHHLLTHTSGLCYAVWDADMFRYTSSPGKPVTAAGPLMFEPGTHWQYGQGLDWTGRLVEAISGMTLEDYFQKNICQPLGMNDTSFLMPAEKFNRLANSYHRSAQGTLVEDERILPPPPKSFNGGGGLYSTASDYTCFMQMILNEGLGPNNVRILEAKSVASMEINQIGDLTAGKMKTFEPDESSDVDIQPGYLEKWGFGFLINPTAYDGGRSAGSLAWAGIENTYFWIDPHRKLCAVILMQFLPFVDKQAVGLLDEFEHAVYAARLA